jgi:Na+/H+ antiporter
VLVIYQHIRGYDAELANAATLGGAVVIPAGYAVLLICGPLAAVAAVWVAERVGVPYPVLLVAVGAVFAWLPWVSVPVLSPPVVFYVFLPPLIYYAAYFIAPDDLRANARSIGLLAVGLVIVTMAAVAGVLVGLVGVPLAVALVAGAVVAPTDAVAATSVFKRLDVPERLATIVEGEGLTNDGTALVLYAGAVGAATVGALRPGPLAVTLLAAPAGGATLGLAVGWAAVQIRRRVDQPLLEITISLATPYLTYMLAESAHLSGVLATVTAGVYVGSHLSAIFAPGARLQAFAFLDVLVFLLNAVLFILVGAELVRSVHWVPEVPAPRFVAAMSAVVIVVIVLRLIWMLFGPFTAKLFRRARGEPVWRQRVVVAWAGMRGGLSLAAALAIPLQRVDGSPFPYRDLVIVVAAAVIVASLLVQGTSLPWLLRRLGLRAEDFGTEENKARLKAAHAALEWLDDQSGAESADEATKSARALYEAKARRLELTPPHNDESVEAREMERYRALRLELLGVERSTVLALRRDGRINATVLRAIERDFDLEEARLSGS